MDNPKTIQIFLPDGNPRSIKLAEITSRTVLAILIPRASLSFMNKRTELSAVGVYLLFGSEDDATLRVYVGEAEDCAKRLNQHNSSKEFWTHALVFVSQKQQFTKSHVKYLEWLCLTKIEKAGRSMTENNVVPSKSYIQEPAEADLLDCFETIETLTSALGFAVFDSLRKTTSSTSAHQLLIKTSSADAKGEYGPDGFTLLSGSKCSKDVSKSFQPTNKKRRQSLIDSAMLKVDGDVLLVVKDILFASPSGAAALVLGRETNGWTAWKYKNGKTLDEENRQALVQDTFQDDNTAS